MTIRALGLATGLLLVVSMNLSPAWSAAPASAAERCASFEGDRFAGGYNYANAPDAPTYVHSSRMNLPANGLPEYCEVKAYISPQIGFVLRLPSRTWNGKLLQTGCGEGYCGSIDIDSPTSLDALRRGYAVTTTDLGHRGTPFDAKWAYNNLQGKLDFAYRATHTTSAVSKLILADFYDRPARKSYFQGCSTGGRQGMVSALLFPDDFDGIIAGAPTIMSTSSPFQSLWAGMSNLDKDGKQILQPADAQVLHRAVVAACDASDGAKDGLFASPAQCKFDPAQAQCKAGQSADCLTAAQVEAARKIYEGPKDSQGRAIHLSGLPLGSELDWVDRVIGSNGQPGSNVAAMTDWFRYMADSVDAGPLWQLGNLNWDEDPNNVGGMAAVYTANVASMSKFKARGGKLIQYHGWQDAAAVPLESVDYYEMTTRSMGGLAATQDFYRLFMIPGMGHCAKGGADAVDYLAYLESWVENGKAPDMLLGKHLENGSAAYTRPHFPYPDLARYKGRGDINDSANYGRATDDRTFERTPTR